METELVPDFDALLGQLTQISRKQLLYFRVQVGRAVSGSLFGGDSDAYYDHAANKEGLLGRFAASRREKLADLGLTEVTLRQCVRAWFVARDLPEGTLEHLQVSHLNLLAQVEDGHGRRLLAVAAVENGWAGLALHQAIRAAACCSPAYLSHPRTGQGEPPSVRPS